MFQSRCGLPISTYFTAVKIRWVFDHCKAVQQALNEGRCCVGTVDTWLLWVSSSQVKHFHWETSDVKRGR